MSNSLSTDPIADMLSRIRNAIAVRKREITLPHSKVKASVAQLLKANGFIDNVTAAGEGTAKTLTLTIFPENAAPRITAIERLSSPGRRHYVQSQAIPVVKRGRGLVIVSTSKGMMTGSEAQAQRIGGELICKVY